MTAPMNSTAPVLITYADRLAGDIAGVGELLDGPLDDVFAGVHLLPFFDAIDGADAGFDPVDHTAVDPRLGTWSDVRALGARRRLTADLIVNHVSADSAEFRSFLALGDNAPQAALFLRPRHVFGGDPTAEQRAAIYRPRPTSPFTDFTFADGHRRTVWTTFTDRQVDIDVEHELGWNYLIDILDRFAAAGVATVRLDAAGYAIKRAGTSCFMLPETMAFIGRLTAACHDRGMTVLVEMHGHHLDQVDLAHEADLVYDFALPPLVLDALFTSDAEPLKRWIDMRPVNAVTVLDTHDGIGVIDVGVDARDPSRAGLLPPDRIHDLVEGIHERSGGASRAATGSAASNVDLYQVNCTFFDALGRDVDAYVAARAVQLLLPGTPQIYYVGLLAGANDIELLAATGVGRDVNRHHYTSADVEAALAQPVTTRLLELLRWRATEPAFEGSFELLDAAPHEIRGRWTSPTSTVTVTVDVASNEVTIER